MSRELFYVLMALIPLLVGLVCLWRGFKIGFDTDIGGALIPAGAILVFIGTFVMAVAVVNYGETLPSQKVEAAK